MKIFFARSIQNKIACLQESKHQATRIRIQFSNRWEHGHHRYHSVSCSYIRKTTDGFESDEEVLDLASTKSTTTGGNMTHGV